MIERPRILALFGSAVLFGQERGNIEALAALKDHGYEVLCLIRDEPWSIHISPALDARGLAWVKVPYIEHRMPGRLRYVLFRNPIALVRANWRFLRIVREFRPTHIHAFNPLYVMNFAFALCLVKAPMIYRAGDEPTVHSWIWRRLWRYVVSRTDRFVANSGFVAQSLYREGVPSDRVSLIYNMPPQRAQDVNAGPMLLDSPKVSTIVFVGQIAEHKGVHVLITAFRAVASDFPNARLVIAGRISEWSGDAWARSLRDSTNADALLKERVSFVGEISAVGSLLDASGIHVAPSIFEDPSPNVVMEAKQAACPSIVFPRGGMPELVEHGVDGIVCECASVQALTEALRAYLSEPDLVYRHGRAARASLTRLGVSRFARLWLDVYEATSSAPALTPVPAKNSVMETRVK